MTEKAEFKVPKGDPKLLAKSRKPEPVPSASKTDDGTFEENAAEIPPIPYKEPKWSGKCDLDRDYSFEVEKNGVIIERVRQLQNKTFWLFGRLPNCDLNMAHPTISRYHAVLQYRPPPSEDADSGGNDEQGSTRPVHTTVEPGWYLYDLNSTHGTFLNKQQIKPRTYVRVRPGYMIRLGSSSRTFILDGPTDEEDEPSALTITELKEHTAKVRALQAEMAEIERKEKDRLERLKEEEGISWGMAEDADEETDLHENPYAASNNEELFLDDPKKTLRGYFEREGYELEYKLNEVSSGTYSCRVELPVDDAGGLPIVATVTHKGKKKEAVVQCALEACRILDRHGLLRQANHEPRRRFQKQSDSDDDDDFLDRTGAVEKRRSRKQAKDTQIRTYEDLIHEEAQILERLEKIELQINKAQLITKKTRLPKNDDDVDDFLNNLVQPSDKFEIRRLRVEQKHLHESHERVKKLIAMVKPIDLASIVNSKQPSSTEQTKHSVLPLFGKRHKLSNTFGIRESSIKAQKDSDVDGGESSRREAPRVPPGESAYCSRKSTKCTSSASALDDAKQPKHFAKKRSLSGASSEGDSDRVRQTFPDEIDPEKGGGGNSKKRRPRNRMRERVRENVDFDDMAEMESEDKNVEWVPPSGQTGDGRTSLNEKFGY
ncbi:LOW QUALITY PROTEIN: kanadaptin [Anopheles bellator]|uniref:LOW QUALITY PROTEIN: kanadaptin n=1 Tax=Anopheles bellator TaxID=139047 RepID=UPI002648CDDF|nr:LOW QUALITY PROTEIN: kanadaptin [Anopheles bellator]